jgi:hypothetical protein
MRSSRLLLSIAGLAGVFALRKPCDAQPRPYIGVLGGVSTLSADARTALDSTSAATSSYKPENGPTAGGYVGLHWTNYFSVQADYLWNRNLLTLDSLAASSTGAGAKFYEQTFQSSQQAAFGNALLYFRPRSSWVRPFLSVGTGVVHFTAEPRSAGTENGLIPPGSFSATKLALHVAVGIDLKFKSGWGIRYSFAETSSSNPISHQLTPAGSRMLANFRNLFGVVKYF